MKKNPLVFLILFSFAFSFILCGFPGKNEHKKPYRDSSSKDPIDIDALHTYMYEHKTHNEDDEDADLDEIILDAMNKENIGHILGIDFGSHYSTVGVVHSNEFELVKDEFDRVKVPSVISFMDDGTILVGKEAQDNLIRSKNLENTVYSFKKLLGRRFDDPYLQKHIRHLSYSIIGVKNDPRISIKLRKENGETNEILYSPEEILALLITKLRMNAESYYHGVTFDSVVISVPTSFTHVQRLAISNSIEIAGLKLKKIVNDSSISAIFHGTNNKIQNGHNLLVFDFGSSSFELSYINFFSVFEEISYTGMNDLGGDDFTYDLFIHLTKKIESSTNNRFNLDQTSKKTDEERNRNFRLFQACEIAMIVLSSKERHTISVKNLFNGYDLKFDLTREDFETISQDTIKAFKSKLLSFKDSMPSEAIEDLIIQGSASKIPIVSRILNEVLDLKKNSIHIHEGRNYIAQGVVLYARDFCIHHTLYYKENKAKVISIMEINHNPFFVKFDLNDTIESWVGRRSYYPFSRKKSIYNYQANIRKLEFDLYEGILKNEKGKEINLDDEESYKVEQVDLSDSSLLARFRLEGIPAEKQMKVKVTIELSINKKGTLEIKILETSSNCRRCVLHCLQGICPRDISIQRDKFLLDKRMIRSNYKKTKEYSKKEDL